MNEETKKAEQELTGTELSEETLDQVAGGGVAAKPIGFGNVIDGGTQTVGAALRKAEPRKIKLTD